MATMLVERDASGKWEPAGSQPELAVAFAPAPPSTTPSSSPPQIPPAPGAGPPLRAMARAPSSRTRRGPWLRPAANPNLSVGFIFGRAFELFDFLLLAQFLLVFVITGASFGIILGGPMMVGFTYCCLKKVDGEKLEFGDLFRGFDNFGNALLAFVLLALGLPFAWACCLFPGIFLFVKFWFWPFVLADRKGRSGIDALGDSWFVTEKRFFDLLLLGVVALGIWLFGLMLCLVGFFPASVIVYLGGAVAYRQLVPKNPAAAAAANS